MVVPDFLADSLGAFPATILAGLACMLLLSVRHRALYWVLFCLLVIAMAWSNVYAPAYAQLALLLLTHAVLPLAMGRGSWGYRVFAVTMAFIVMFVSDALTTALWPLISEAPLTGTSFSEDAAALVPARVLDFFLEFALYSALLPYCERLKRRGMGVKASSGDKKDALHLTGSYPYFIGFLLVQATMLCVFVRIFEQKVLEGFSFLPFAVFCIVCVVADVLLFVVMGRCEAQAYDAMRAEVLAAQLDACLNRSQAVVEEVEVAARMRHDLRNQVQVAMMLIERGQRDRARACLVELSQGLATWAGSYGQMGADGVEGEAEGTGEPLDACGKGAPGVSLRGARANGRALFYAASFRWAIH